MSKQRSKQAVTDKSRCTVRECDETEKGKFIAYVDEKNESYDVSISLDPEKNLVHYSCDCGNEKICTHVKALLNHVTTNHPKKTRPAGVKKKGLQLILESADPNKIKDWLWKLISTNEEVKILFTNEFDTPAQFDPGKVKELVRNTRKAIIGKEDYPEQKTLSRFAKVLVSIQKPVVNFYLEAPFEHANCEVVKAMLEGLDELSQEMHTEILTIHYTDLLTPIAGALKTLNDEGSFQLASERLMVGLKLNKPSGFCVMEVLSLLIKTASFNRSYFLIKELADRFYGYNDQTYGLINLTAKLYYDCLVSYNLLAEFGDSIPAAILDKQANKNILQQLIDSGNLEIASERLWTMYQNAVTPEEKLWLLQQLKIVNIQLGDESEILKVLEILVPINYEYEDFLLLQKYLVPEKLDSLKQHMIAEASAQLYKDPAKFRFAFQLFGAENNYEKMLRFLHRSFSYQIIESSFESLIAFDSIVCLQQMFGIRDKLGPDSDYNANHDEFESVKRLVKITLKKYQEDEIRLAIKKYYGNTGHQVPANYYTKMLSDAVA